MQNAFSISGWSWGLLAVACVAVPLLIHLIQLHRHQKIRWAAMAFLLRSQQRSRRWLRLKQWLLIASRIGLLLLGLIAISQLRCDQVGVQNYFADATVTHHLLLLDDSYSMAEKGELSDPQGNAVSAAIQLLQQLETLPNQRVSLVTFSQADQWNQHSLMSQAKDGAAESSGSAGDSNQNVKADPEAIVDGQVVTKELVAELKVLLSQMPRSMVSSGPASAVRWAQTHAAVDPETTFVAHVLSDFRQAQWGEQSQVWQTLVAANAIDQVNFVDCGNETARPLNNLSVVDLKPVGELNTTSTGFVLQCTVRNHGVDAATNVVVPVEVWQNIADVQRIGATNGQAASGQMLGDSALIGKAEDWRRSELPALLFEEIPAGETARQQFSLSFSHPGQPVVRVTLPDDDLLGDNQRQVIVPAPESVSVLVIDQQGGQGSWYLEQSLNPAGLTGVRCQTQTADYLEKASDKVLQQFKWIALIDAPQLDAPIIDRLKKYVSDGGGLIWFVGPQVPVAFYNGPLYRSGLFPVRLERSVNTPERLEGEVADLQVAAHPVFQPFLMGDQAQLEAVVFKQLWKVDVGTIDAVVAKSDFGPNQVLASFRGKPQWPLIIEHQWNRSPVSGSPPDESEEAKANLDETSLSANPQADDSPDSVINLADEKGGRVLTFLSTIDGQWNNWPQELTFPAAIMLMADYVARQQINEAVLIAELPKLDRQTWQKGLLQASGLPWGDTLDQSSLQMSVSKPITLDHAGDKWQQELGVWNRRWFAGSSSGGSDAPQGDGNSSASQLTGNGRVNAAAVLSPGPVVYDQFFQQQDSVHWQRSVSVADLRESQLQRIDVASVSAFDAPRFRRLNWNQLLWQTESVANRGWLRPMVLAILAMMVVEAALAWWMGPSS